MTSLREVFGHLSPTKAALLALFAAATLGYGAHGWVRQLRGDDMAARIEILETQRVAALEVATQAANAQIAESSAGLLYLICRDGEARASRDGNGCAYLVAAYPRLRELLRR